MSNTLNKAHKSFIAYLLFFIWPFFALVFAICNYRASYFKNIVWLFCGFIGYTFVIPDATVDANRYAALLSNWYAADYAFFDFYGMLWRGEMGKGDFIQPTITYLVAQVTDNVQVLFACFGLVMGYFYSRSINILIQQGSGKIKQIALPFLLLFIFLVPIWQLNGFRFWLATHIFLYGCLKWFLLKEKRGLFIAACSILAHLSFVLAVGLLVVKLLIGNKKYIYLLAVVGGLALGSLSLSVIIQNLPVAEGTQVERAKGYTHADYVEKVIANNANSVWFMRWRREGLKILLLIGFLFLSMTKGEITKRLKTNSLLLFSVLLFLITFLLNNIPSIGRFFAIAFLLFAASAFIYAQKGNRNYWLYKAFPIWLFPILLYIIVEIRIGMSFIGLGAIVSNPVLSSYFFIDVSLLNLIR